jgi:CBS domain-containing protein
MVTSVVAAHEGAVFKEIVDALIRNRVSAVPVIADDRRVLGVVSEADLLARVSKAHLTLPRGHRLSAHSEERRKLHAATASALMTSPAYVIAPHASIADAAWHAARNRVRRLPVVDDNGVLVGIVTRSDLLRGFLRPDEDIRDDITQNLIVGAFMLDPNSVEVSVEEGVVTLRGQVERRSIALEIVDNVRNWSGVVDVDDKLTYQTDDTQPTSVPAVLY